MMVVWGVGLMVSCIGCSTYVTIKSVRPAQFSIGMKPNVAVIEAKGGRRNNQDAFIENLIKESRRRGFFVVQNRVSEGIRFEIQDGRTVLTGKTIPFKDGDALLKFEMLDAETNATEEERQTDLLGLKKEKFPITETKQGISISIGTTQKTLDQKEVNGRATWDKGKEPKEKQEMVEAAIANAAWQVMEIISPRYEDTKVRMDDSDEAQKPILTEVGKGNLQTAKELLEKYLAANPNSGSAHYNLAVVTDAMGQYAVALPLYEKAESLASQSYYAEAKSNCMRRVNESSELK